MFQSKIYNLSCAALATITLSSCGSSQYINSATLSSHVTGGDEYVTLAANINSSGLVLPAIQFPIIDLRNPSISFGDVSLVPSIDGKSTDLTVDVDLSQALKLPKSGQSVLLPNGTALPISGIDPSQTFQFNIGGNGSKVYLEFDSVNKKAFIGTAVVISQFRLGALLDLFIPFSSNSISGTAGIFTGPSFGQSGIGVFADLSSLLTGKLLAVKASQNIPRLLMSQKSVSQPHQFMGVAPSNKNKLKIQNMLLKLQGDQTELEIR